jgi:hypothetical protein
MRVKEVLSDSPAFAKAQELRLPRKGDVYSLGAERGAGKFGYVWAAEPRDPRPDEPAFVVKESKGLAQLGDRVTALQHALAGSPDPEWAERLLAFPFSVVRADFEGDEHEAIFMLDLAELGYEKAGPVFETGLEEFLQRPVNERVELTQSFVRAAATLEEVGFIHGDQNLPNLMLNFGTLDAQIIDLDAGAILVTGRERAAAQGKMDDCRPPEVAVLTANGWDVDRNLWDQEAERWSVGSLVGYLSFGIHPAFFLLRATASIIDLYAEEGPWPNFDLSVDHASPGSEARYKFWRPLFEAAPGHLTETFVRFFRAGTRGHERPTAQDWIDALEPARQKPQFTSLELEPTVAPEGTEVVIRWEALGAEYVEHPELGRLPAKGEETLLVSKSARHVFTAVNYYGRTEGDAGVVRMVPLPKLTSIPIAAFPGLELQAQIATAAPPRMVSGLPPRLVQSPGISPTAPMAARGPQVHPAPPRFGQLFRPIPVPRISKRRRKEPTK